MRRALDALEGLHTAWSRPVHLETALEGMHVLLTFDGQEHSEVEMKAAQFPYLVTKRYPDASAAW